MLESVVAGVNRAARLGKVKRVDLSGTRVTEQGVAELRRALPGVEILH